MDLACNVRFDNANCKPKRRAIVAVSSEQPLQTTTILNSSEPGLLTHGFNVRAITVLSLWAGTMIEIMVFRGAGGGACKVDVALHIRPHSPSCYHLHAELVRWSFTLTVHSRQILILHTATPLPPPEPA